MSDSGDRASVDKRASSAGPRLEPCEPDGLGEVWFRRSTSGGDSLLGVLEGASTACGTVPCEWKGGEGHIMREHAGVDVSKPTPSEVAEGEGGGPNGRVGEGGGSDRDGEDHIGDSGERTTDTGDRCGFSPVL